MRMAAGLSRADASGQSEAGATPPRAPPPNAATATAAAGKNMTTSETNTVPRMAALEVGDSWPADVPSATAAGSAARSASPCRRDCQPERGG